MRLSRRLVLYAVGLSWLNAGLASALAQVGRPPVASHPLLAFPPPPSSTNAALVWDAELKSIEVSEADDEGHLFFSCTNISPHPVVIRTADPGCHCTTLQTPELPWTIPAGSNGTIGVTIDLRGKTGTLFKNIYVATDEGEKTLIFRVDIQPVALPLVTEADRARMLTSARADRQAVFKGDCVACHVKPGQGKYGKELYAADCGICHEAEPRATMVPDLHKLKAATNQEFWRVWIAHGKPGGLMPAFASAEGGPLSETQITSLCLYLSATIQSSAAP